MFTRFARSQQQQLDVLPRVSLFLSQLVFNLLVDFSMNFRLLRLTAASRVGHRAQLTAVKHSAPTMIGAPKWRQIQVCECTLAVLLPG